MSENRLADLTVGPEPEALAILIDMHNRWYSEYDYVIDIIEENARLPQLRNGIVNHQTLLFIDDVPAGYIMFATNLRRRVGVGFYMAVENEFRGRGLGKLLEDHAIDVVAADAIGHGVEILAYVGEVAHAVKPILTKWGFVDLPVDYAEPLHGAAWSSFGEPTFNFNELTLMAHHLPDIPLDVSEVAVAGAEAFLLDHYNLPSDNPTVVRCTQPPDSQRLRGTNHAGD